MLRAKKHTAIKANANDVVLSGHGSVEIGHGETTVPGGVELVVLAPPGATISDRLGGMIERGEEVKQLKISSAYSGQIRIEPTIYRSGTKAPNFVLHPPRGLHLRPGVPHMLGVEEETTLDTLWPRVLTFTAPGKTIRCYWCACSAITDAGNEMVDAM